jgi:hypothetical protein
MQPILLQDRVAAAQVLQLNRAVVLMASATVVTTASAPTSRAVAVVQSRVVVLMASATAVTTANALTSLVAAVVLTLMLMLLQVLRQAHAAVMTASVTVATTANALTKLAAAVRKLSPQKRMMGLTTLTRAVHRPQ